jgi:RluA family pseudouridine synthase
VSAHPWTSHPILFEDEHLLVIHKPSGVLSHPNHLGQPAAFFGTYNISTRCFSHLNQCLCLLHRLDEDTSGVLLAAKTTQAHQKLRLDFDSGKVRKYYQTLLAGKLEKTAHWQDHLITQSHKGSRRTQSSGQLPFNAQLVIHPTQFYPSQRLTLANIDLITGKTHQIRFQSAKRNIPVLGDDLYGNFQLNRTYKKQYQLKRLFLHSHHLQIYHPHTRQILNFKAPLPEDLSHLLKQLR